MSKFLEDTEPKPIVVRPCSWRRLSTLLGEWHQFEMGRIGMSVDRAMTIAGYALAVASAAARGDALPRDWGSCHPSLPRQMERKYEAIVSHPVVALANRRPDIFIEFPSAGSLHGDAA